MLERAQQGGPTISPIENAPTSMSTHPTLSSLTVVTSVTSPTASLNVPTSAAPWMHAPRAPTVVATTPLTTRFVTASTTRPGSEPAFQSYLGLPITKPQCNFTPFVVATQPLDTYVVPTTVFGPTPSFTFGTRVPTSSGQAVPSRLTSTSTDRHSSAFVSISGKESQFTSESTPFPQQSPWHESEDLPIESSYYPQTITDFLRGFATSQGEGSPFLHVRQLRTAISRMGFTLDEHLPAAEQPNQRDLSTFAYLQIAVEVPSDRIIVLNLPEFSDLVAEAVKKQYPAFGKSIPYRTISVDKLLNFSKMIVRDPLGILRKETATAALPALLPPPPAVPSMIYPPPPKWFFQMLANKITTPPTTVVPTPQSITVVLRTLNTEIGQISLEPFARTQAPSTGADLPGDSSQADNAAPSLEVSDDKPLVTNVAQGAPGVEFNAAEFTDVLGGLDQIQTPIITTQAPQETTRTKTTALTTQSSKSGQSSQNLRIAPKKCAPKPSKPKRSRQNSPPQESESITAISKQIEVVQ